MKKVIMTALILSTNFVHAHSMTPGFVMVDTYSDVTEVTYNVSNELDFHATFDMEVLNKDMSEATDWKMLYDISKTVKVKNKDDKSVTLKFKTESSRKIIVCSTLSGVGYDMDKPQLVTRVCSRLYLKRI